MAACFHNLCGRTFGGLFGFDRHIRLLDAYPWLECRDPAAVGMVPVDGVWVRESPKSRMGPSR